MIIKLTKLRFAFIFDARNNKNYLPQILSK